MNTPIVRTYLFVLFLLAILVYFTSKWAVFDASELEASTENRRALIETAQVPRGTITTADGEVIAESTAEGRGENAVYSRTYPGGTLYSNPVGTSYIETGQTGIERSEEALLSGQGNEFQSLIDQVQNKRQAGADVTLTIDSNIQQVATDALQSAISSTSGSNGAGSVVAIEPDTGAIKAMVSIPTYDPNSVLDDLEALNTDDAAPLVNRPTQSAYAPGSTFKLVTAAAALDSGEFTPDTVLDGSTGIEIGGVPLSNAGGESPGPIAMTEALYDSINTYFAQVGEQLGPATMYEYMRRFGFESDPELDYPDIQMRASGVYDPDDLNRLQDEDEPVDIGRVAIGQANLLSTPVQMAQVAATIANGGELMEPTFLQQATDPDGRTIAELDPTVQDRAISEETADQLTEMMTSVTENGTAAGLTVGGASFAGKTGTAEIDVAAGTNRPWFVGFAPADDPQIAVAVMLETCQGCFGGEVSGPVATQVMEAAIGG